MSRAPAFQFYAKDWLASSFVRLLTPNLRATYFDLLCYQAIDDGLPSDPEQIRLLSGIGKRAWNKAWEILEPKFPVSPDGRRRNPKQDQVMREREEFIESKRTAGKQGAMKRWQKDGTANSTDVAQPMAQPIANGMANACPSSASAVEPESKTNPTHPPLSPVRAPAPDAANGGATQPPTPVGDFSLSRSGNPRTIADPEAVHRLVAAGVDSQLADLLVAKEAEARRRIGGGV